MKNTQISNTAANIEANAIAALFNNGYLNIYSGVQPVDANTALTGQTLLVSLHFGSPAFGAAVNGVINITSGVVSIASNNGTASFFRCFEQDNTTVIMDGSVDISGNTPNLSLSTTTITVGLPISIGSFSFSVLESTAGE